MTVFSLPRLASFDRHRASHVLPIALAALVGAGAIIIVAYLLWPTWSTESSGAPDRLPVSIGGTLFNVPVGAIRMKVQRHSGPAERIDLDFGFPSLEPPQPHISADEIDEKMQPIDRIFLSIAAHQNSLAPEMRVRTIYPRYLEQASTPDGGLTVRAFRDGSPYGGEDLLLANAPAFTARCTRDAATPGMCLSERRIEGADLTFRFPKAWVAHWRDVAGAMDRLTAQLRGMKN
jgi:hypothetical protein